MSIEVQHRNWAVQTPQRAQQRQRDGVVAAQRHQSRAVLAQLFRCGGNGGDRLVDVERVDGDVAGVGDLLRAERVHILRRVVRAQQF